MQKLFKAVVRDIWYYRYRSFITFLAIFAVIVFPIAMFSTSPNVSSSIWENNDFYKLSHLDLRVANGNQSIVPLINETIYDTLGKYPEAIETRLLARGKSEIGNTWEATTLVGIPKAVNHSINQLSLVQGNTTLGNNEIYAIESFAKYYQLDIGSNLTILIGNSEVNLTIAGWVRSVEFLSYGINQEGVIYLDEELLHALVGLPNYIINSITIYFWEDIPSENITICSAEMHEIFEAQGVVLLFQWQMREISVSAVLRDALELTSRYLNASAIIIIIVVGIVIYIITKRYALEQRKQTGTLYAFGYSPSSILKAFLLRTTLICVGAMIVGTFAGYGLLRIIVNILLRRWGLIGINPQLSPVILIGILTLTLIMAIFFTWLAARSNVRMTPYEAIRGKVKEYIGKKLNNITHWKTAFKYPIRNISRNKSRSILTFLAFAGSIMLSFSLIAAQSSVNSTKETYFSEQIQWDVKTVFRSSFTPTTFQNLSNLPGIIDVEYYLETVVQSEDYLDNLVYLRGIETNSTMCKIDLQDGSPFTNSTSKEIIMSIYVAERIGLRVGDEFSFWFSGLEINTTIIGLSRDLELTVTIYMQLSALEDIMGYSPYNGMFLNVVADELPSVIEQLNRHEDVAYAFKKDTFENRIQNLIKSQTIIVNVMVFLGFLTSFLAIFATTFISSIEREREYALLRVFGFSSAQILGQLLFEIFLLCTFALLIGLGLGNGLAFYWNSILSSIFFTVDLYQNQLNYLISVGFAVISMLISIFPAFRLISKQVLAKAIEEE